MLVKKKKSGFTLVELLISISILGFVIGVSYTLFQGNIRLFNQKTNQVTSENDLRILVDWVTKDLKNTIPNSVSNLKNNNDGTYSCNIGKITYTMVEIGKIESRKVFKLVRQSDKDGKIDLINSISEGSSGFNISMPTDSEPYYTVKVTIIDKFNKDRFTSFKVSSLTGKSGSILVKTDTPIINKPVIAGSKIIRGTAEANASITVKIGTRTIGTGIADGTGSYLVELGTILGNNDIVTVTALAAGKIESDPASATVTSNGQWANCVIVAKNLSVSGGAVVDAPSATLIIKDNTINTVKLDGGTYISAAKIYINHNVDLEGSANIGNSDNSSSIYINGNITLSGKTYIYNNLYYTGKLSVPEWINLSGTKVNSVTFPSISIPSLQLDSWYTQREFTSEATARDGMKCLISSSYTFPTWEKFSNVNVVSKGNITLNGGVIVDGILFAPNGTVTVEAGASFHGIIVAKNVDISGGAKVKFKPFNLSDLPFKQ